MLGANHRRHRVYRHPPTRCVPLLEELEYRNLLAATGPGSLLPTAVAPATAHPAATVAPGATRTQAASITFFPPASLTGPLGTTFGLPGALLPIGVPGATTSSLTGALPTNPNTLTPEQVLAQRIAITLPLPVPPPFNAGGEGMLYYVTPSQNLENTGTSNTNTSSELTDSRVIVNGTGADAQSASAPVLDWAAVIDDFNY